MTTPRTRASRTRKDKDAAVSETTLQVVSDSVEETPVETPKRTMVRRDLTPTGLGVVGGFEDVDDDAAVPSTTNSKESEVEYLYEPMRQSYDTAKWKNFVVTDAEAAERAIRLAAMKLDYGVKIRQEAVQFEDVNGDTVDGTRMYFKTGVKKVRKTSQGE